MMNIAIVGLNQVYDKKIDKVRFNFHVHWLRQLQMI